MTKASKIAVTMLDVGQGSGTFVEIYTGTKITATALLDLGSERAKDEAGGPSVDYLVKQLTSMTKPRIDFFSLSHSDSDHINLVQDLLAFFDPPGTKKPKKPILEIGSVIYGGPRVLYAKHSGTNVLTSIEAYQPKGTTKPQPLPSNNSSFYGTAPMFAKDEVEIRLLVGNHVSSEPRTVRKKIGDKQWRTDSYSLNTYSLIFVVAFDDWEYVITGDATGATIAQANYIIKNQSVKFANVAAMTMPHHSSEPTTFGLTASRTKRQREKERVPDAAKKVIDAFAASVAPRTIHASAEDVGSFRHPSAFVMSYFWDYVDTTSWYDDPVLTGNQHLYNAYFMEEDDFNIVLEEIDPKSKKKKKRTENLPPFDDWWTFATQHAIFTNRYYVRPQAYDPAKNETATFPPDPGKVTSIPKSGATTSPPFAVAWRYTSVASTGNTDLERLVNRKDGDDFVAVPVMRMTKDRGAAGKARPVADAPAALDTTPSRTMALRPPARIAELHAGGEHSLHVRPLRRLRQIDV
ncbi:hypothetical protein DAH55_09485 [Sphingomonas koreensis]|uniref:hypothetical protein n=1 Tax=Sphingomonas koreensis TaxID=93064 RepID=UPI00082D0F55|nr:hypothetical protein [Sphingomonas koreensis]PJI88814.1 hypothetical protein BDW16_2106 [Sphingomonas koreensis]RSU63583.1 hypothetical protein DAH56_01610 [Sphingomonas koreensis]RSU69223.1 hypothetical protein DAH55_09485 [Sphingomonas koreensis]